MGNPIKLYCTVDSVESLCDHIYRVSLRADKSFPNFRAGQFLHLSLDEYNPHGGFWPESRVFSIASRPGADRAEIIYSVKGHYTSRMEKELKRGREVWVKLPFGEFTVEDTPESSETVLIAGGTGISPFLPFLARIDENARTKPSIALYYGVRRREHLISPELLSSCAISGKVRVFVAVEEGGMTSAPGLCLSRGRFAPPDIQANVAKDAIYYISGPPAMVFSYRNSFLALGVAPGAVKIDQWE